MLITKKLTSSLVCLFILMGVYSQNDTIHLEELQVSANIFDSRINTSIGGLSILHPKIEERSQIINCNELLNTLGGVHVGTGSYTTNRISIRGIGSRTPYSSNRIRVYFEGIPLTDGSGTSSIEDIDLNAISSIEILKGPGSAIYGSGLGGAILMKARVPEMDGFTGLLSSSFQSFNTQKHRFYAGWKNDITSVSLGYAHARSMGYRENSEFERDHAYVLVRHRLKKNIFGFNILFSGLKAEIPSSLTASDFKSRPESAARNWLAINGYEASSRVGSSLSWETELRSSLYSRLTIHGSWSDPYEKRPFNILDDQSSSLGFREILEYEKSRLNLRVGIEMYHENYLWEIFEILDEGRQGELQVNNQESRDYANAFIYGSWKASDRLWLESGINMNILNYSLTTLYHHESLDQSGEYRYKPVVSPRAGLNYSLARGHYLHFSGGHGFSAPSLEETLLPDGLINNALRPESGWNLELGVRGKAMSASWSYDLSVYRIYVNNMLLTKRISEEIFTGINAGRASLSGVEGNSVVKILQAGRDSNWELQSAFHFDLSTNIFSQFVDDGIDYSGKKLPGIPLYKLRGSLIAGFKNSKVQMDINHIGQQFLDDANTGTLSAYTLINFKAFQQITFGRNAIKIRLGAYISNLFDVSYASMVLINAPSFGTNQPRYYYPGFPRNSGLSVQLQID